MSKIKNYAGDGSVNVNINGNGNTVIITADPHRRYAEIDRHYEAKLRLQEQDEERRLREKERIAEQGRAAAYSARRFSLNRIQGTPGLAVVLASKWRSLDPSFTAKGFLPMQGLAMAYGRHYPRVVILAYSQHVVDVTNSNIYAARTGATDRADLVKALRKAASMAPSKTVIIDDPQASPREEAELYRIASRMTGEIDTYHCDWASGYRRENNETASRVMEELARIGRGKFIAWSGSVSHSPYSPGISLVDRQRAGNEAQVTFAGTRRTIDARDVCDVLHGNVYNHHYLPDQHVTVQDPMPVAVAGKPPGLLSRFCQSLAELKPIDAEFTPIPSAEAGKALPKPAKRGLHYDPEWEKKQPKAQHTHIRRLTYLGD